MIQAQTALDIRVDDLGNLLELKYAPVSGRTIYDICDYNGRILQTGEITSDKTLIGIRDMNKGKYILLVLDGERVWSQKFKISR